MRELAGLQVVVTRPIQSADKLVQQFTSYGANAVAIPLLAIETLIEPSQRAQIAQHLDHLSECDVAIFISQHAAEQTMLVLEARQQSWPTGVQAFAVGKSTAAFLQQCGITASFPEQMDSEGLLALPGLQKVDGQRCIIFRGLGGRETLALTLRERGATVDYCELYRRTRPADAERQWRTWRDRNPSADTLVCINSVESLVHLVSVLDALDAVDTHKVQAVVDCQRINRDNLTLLVPSERVARAAHQRGFSQVVVAQDALDDTVIAAALHWYRFAEHKACMGKQYD
jgi:uroporphyrinogen-III synthase